MALLSAFGCPAAFGEEVIAVPDNLRGGLRIEYDNDLLMDSDDKFTNGVSVQWHSRASKDWGQIGFPGWMTFGRHLPGLNSLAKYKRLGLAIGQNMQTPSDLSETELIKDDVPYAGSLGVEINWIAFDDNAFVGYALILGVVGPASGASGVQKRVHKLMGADRPNGWDNQLPNEPALNFNGMFKRKILRTPEKSGISADLALNADFGLGTALLFGEVAAELRAGLNLPVGFAFVPDPIGRTIAYDATIGRYPEHSTSLYLSFVYRQTYMQHFVFLDGSLWRESHRVPYDRWQRQAILGLHLAQRRWGVHVSFWESSASINTPRASGGNDFGTIAIEWRF